MAETVFQKKGRRVSYKVGTMIEIPRACVTADEIAETAEFFSFGTNDLTQTGIDRICTPATTCCGRVFILQIN